MPDFAGALVVDHFEVADGRLAARAPIHYVAAAIDQPLAIQPQKRFEHGAVKRWLEREMLARPIARRAEADHLLLDHAAAFLFPFPDAPLEFLAAEVLAADFFRGQLALDHELRGDAGVVHSREPQRAVAAHAVPADEHVDLRVLEHVADVDRSGDIRRRERDREGRPVAGIFGAEEFLVEPGLRPALFDLLRLVSLGYFPGHAFPMELDFLQKRNIHDKRRAREASIWSIAQLCARPEHVAVPRGAASSAPTNYTCGSGRRYFAAQTKLAASSMLPAPLYLAICG